MPEASHAYKKVMSSNLTTPEGSYVNNPRLINTNMPSTYTQIYIQVVMVVKNRKALISPSWEEELYKYITGIVQEKGQKMLAINGMPNHLHFFIGMKPECQLSGPGSRNKKSVKYLHK